MALRQSLRWRLMVVIGLSLVGLWLLLAPWMLHSVRTEMQKTLDDRLAASARMVASLINRQQLQQNVTAPADSAGAGDSTGKGSEASEPGSAIASPAFPSSLACRVSNLRGEVLAVSRHGPAEVLQNTADGYANREVGGQRWRVYTTTVEGLRISTADRLSTRDNLMTAVVIAAAVPFLLALAGTLMLVGIGIQRSLRPLQQLSESVARREPDNLAPLQWGGKPVEVEPLVHEFNHLLSRVDQAMQRERRFTGDAAHELRTPLTAIKTQLQVARLTDGEPAARSLQQAEKAVEKLQTTLDQLLLLARLEGNAAFDDSGHMSADEISSEAVREVASKAAGKEVHINYQTGCDGEVAAPAALAVAALRNLLENAIRFSPPGDSVLLESAEEDNCCVWTVRDHGPGIPKSQLQALGRRFVHSESSGSGLGLAIVETIARRFSGSLKLGNYSGGARAELRLPLTTGGG